MHISDPVYGRVDIIEPILLALLRSPALIRLKNISQYGLPDDYYHLDGFSRYEHSIGVMLLLRQLGTSLEEQVAGLLHDVSHMAFSHVADYVFAQGAKGVEEHQNTIHSAFIQHTEIPQVIKQNGFKLTKILNEDNFPVLEKLLPDLCADRVDYALREFHYWLNPTIVKQCLSGLTVFKGEIIFTNEQVAYIFSTNYIQLQTLHWGGYEAMMRYYLFSELLKYALARGVIVKKDFYGEEAPIMAKLESSDDKKIQRQLNILNRRKLPILKPKIGKKVFKKFRYVDPKVLVGQKTVRLSQLRPKYLRIIAKHKQKNKMGLLV